MILVYLFSDDVGEKLLEHESWWNEEGEIEGEEEEVEVEEGMLGWVAARGEKKR